MQQAAGQARRIRPPLSLSAASWAMFEGARNPYVILITIYVFMPYFTTVVVGDAVRGQALVARYNQWAGWGVALTAPLLGAVIDKLGPRKPWLFVTVALLVPSICALWWARADGAGLSVAQVLALTSLIAVLFAYTEILHNSMLMPAAGARGVHLASGLALSLGNATSVGLLIFVLWAFALPGRTDWSLVPAAPLFGVDAARHEPARIVAPLVAGLFAAGCLPLFLFSRDAACTGLGLRRAFGEGLRSVLGLFGALRGERDAAVFLAARMFYVDGVSAFLVFGGIYAAGVMRWSDLEMLAYGVLLSVTAIFGGLFGAWMDDRLGPRRAVQIALTGVLASVLVQVGTDAGRVAFFWPYEAVRIHSPSDWPMFNAPPDWVFVAAGVASAMFVPATYASSRTLLTRLVPPNRIGAFFGLYALSGTATGWLAAGLVTLFTDHFGSQQAGFAPVAGLMVIGLAGLWLVRGGGRLGPSPGFGGPHESPGKSRG